MDSPEEIIELITWPLSRLGELIGYLARDSKLSKDPIELPQPRFEMEQLSDIYLDGWIKSAAGYLDVEVEPFTVFYDEVEKMIRGSAPAILRLPGLLENGRPGLIALLKRGKKSVLVLTPGFKKKRINVEVIRNMICAPYDSAIIDDLNQLLEESEVDLGRRDSTRKAVLQTQLAPVQIDCGWMLRQSPGFHFWRQFKNAGTVRPLVTMFGLYFLQLLLTIAAWFVIARGIFQGNYDWGWLLAWVILLFAAIPVSLIVGDAQNELALRTGTVFKRRLLYGTLRLQPEEIRHQGRGQFLGRVMESESVEMLAINGGFLAMLSFIELCFAFFVLAKGAGGSLHAVLLVLWVFVVLGLLYRYYRIAKNWAVIYRSMTNELVENMVGHRTRLAQEDPDSWHELEDLTLDSYLKQSEKLDRVGIQLNSLSARGWMVLGMLGIVFPFITNEATSVELAISLGGILLAVQALNRLLAGSQNLVNLFITWDQVQPLFEAAARPLELPSLDYLSQRSRSFENNKHNFYGQRDQPDREPLLVGRELKFQYTPQSRPVLEDCFINIYKGDRILLEGSSGSGKSTLAAILTGLRKPVSGTLILHGVDRQVMGTQEWRKSVVMAPQFQENHIFSETFAFNLLMGRRWPPKKEDLEQAEQICRDLGLDELLNKMPSGFQQMIGENGWQLSHGERSRLFIARTILQEANLIIFDESFGALDPENLKRSLQTVLSRAPSLLVIAHP